MATKAVNGRGLTLAEWLALAGMSESTVPRDWRYRLELWRAWQAGEHAAVHVFGFAGAEAPSLRGCSHHCRECGEEVDEFCVAHPAAEIDSILSRSVEVTS